jgi:prolipoprotein diacylglyceryl transferase
MLASLPSPSDGVINIGPLPLHVYGLMIALGFLAGLSLMGKRLERAGAGTRDDVNSVAPWMLIGGVVGARLYHVVTEWERFSGDLGRVVEVWNGGLGIPGGVLVGSLAGMWAIRRRGVPISAGLTAAAPALPLAQAIGRWGNWWNQELYGRATTLPWGLRIDEENLVAGALPGQVFHPTFLYESLWNLALCGVLIMVDRYYRPRPGRLFAMYLVGYSVGRLWVEGLRIDPTKSGGGLRLNQWMAIVVGVVAGAYLLIDWLRHRNTAAPDDQHASASPPGPDDAKAGEAAMSGGSEA